MSEGIPKKSRLDFPSILSHATPCTSRSRPRKKGVNYNDTTSSAVNKLQKICETAKEDFKEDEFDIYGKYVANQLRNLTIITAMEAQTHITAFLSNARIQDIKKQNENGNPIPSQQQTSTAGEMGSPYYANTPYTITSDSNSQYSFEEALDTELPSQLSSTSDILSQALDSIM